MDDALVESGPDLTLAIVTPAKYIAIGCDGNDVFVTTTNPNHILRAQELIECRFQVLVFGTLEAESELSALVLTPTVDPVLFGAADDEVGAPVEVSDVVVGQFGYQFGLFDELVVTEAQTPDQIGPEGIALVVCGQV